MGASLGGPKTLMEPRGFRAKTANIEPTRSVEKVEGRAERPELPGCCSSQRHLQALFQGSWQRKRLIEVEGPASAARHAPDGAVLPSLPLPRRPGRGRRAPSPKPSRRCRGRTPPWTARKPRARCRWVAVVLWCLKARKQWNVGFVEKGGRDAVVVPDRLSSATRAARLGSQEATQRRPPRTKPERFGFKGPSPTRRGVFLCADDGRGPPPLLHRRVDPVSPLMVEATAGRLDHGLGKELEEGESFPPDRAGGARPGIGRAGTGR